MPNVLKSLVNRTSPARAAWSAWRRAQLHREYERRREYYAAASRERGLLYREAATVAAVRARLAARGVSPVERVPGEIHTFAFIPSYTWHEELLPDLEELGRLTVFDYRREGFDWNDFARADRSGLAARATMNDRALAAVKVAHAARPVDWVFVYASGIEIMAGIVRRIGEELGIPTVNMCLDDKQSWSGPWMGDHRGGQVDLAEAFDVSWTSARVACEWYLVEGGRPLYMPEGFDQTSYYPMQTPRDIPVSFVGRAYGFRPGVVSRLRKHGVEVRTFGAGWAHAEEAMALRDIANRSVINLGMGGIGYSASLTNIKGRDFQVSGTGGGVYLTSFNADLARHFVVGDEILCYRSDDEMLELVRYYLASPDEAAEIARRARERCLREHRWIHRYRRICEALGILEAGDGGAVYEEGELPA